MVAVFLCQSVFGHLPLCRAQVSTGLVLPVQNYTSSVALGFGDPNPSYGNERHLGEDVVGTAGTPVQAAGAGTVMLARTWKSCPNWGYILVMEHTIGNGSKISTIYGHLDPSTVAVTEGQTIAQGTVLGRTGSYPCWQDHLHFGIRVGPFGSGIGVYPPWLAGYLAQVDFPAAYCEPSTFIRNGVCAFFNFALDSLRVVGNVNGGAGFFDDFNDGSLTTPPTSNIICNLNTAPVSESVGFLHLASRDGANTFSPNFLVDNCILGLNSPAFRLNDGSGNSVITASFRADVPLPGQAYGLQLFTTTTSELVNIQMRNSGSGPVLTALVQSASGAQTSQQVPVSLTMVQRVLLRLTFDDSTNHVTHSFSTDGGITFTAIALPQPGTVMTTGSQAVVSVFGSVFLQ